MPGDPLIGQEIDGYRILEELGRGGMGVVYKAEEVALGREVAIKMIAQGLVGDESFAQKFQREARALARVSSHHITGIYTLRRTDVGLFIVMEYVGGGSLSDRLERGAMSWAEARPIVLQALTALHDAHSVGVVHRDIKPGNILLTEQGVVKVTDFGLAKLYDADPTATVTRAVSGTLNYMAPEQVQGAHDLDGRTDLYALGVTIYEMLSGRLPFEPGGGEYATMRTIVEEESIPLSRFVKKLPVGLEAAVMRALAKAPENRFGDADAMSAAFEAIPAANAVPSARAISADETSPAGDKAAPAVFKAIQAAFKAIPATFKATPAAPLKRAAAETVVEEDAYVPVKPPRRPIPIRSLLYALGGGLAFVALVLLVWWLLPRELQSSAALSVVSDPSGAVVFLNGEEVGETPLEMLELDVNEGDLRVTLEGYVRVDTHLVFGADPLALRLVLQRRGELLSGRDAGFVVTSMPSRATVFVNDRRRGLTPYRLDSVGLGPLTVRVEAAGHLVWRQTGVLPGQTDTLHATLQPVQIIVANPPPRDRPPVNLRPDTPPSDPRPDTPPDDPRPDPPPVDPPPTDPSCDRAALEETIAKLEETCSLSEPNSLARSTCNSNVDRLRRDLARCGQ